MDDELQIAYLAGIIDGEGTITIHRHRQHNRPTYQMRPRLIVSNTNRLLLGELQRRHGGTVITNNQRKKHKPHHKDVYLWRVCGTDELFALIQKLRPHLIVKGALAEVMLKYLASRQQARREALEARTRQPPYSKAEIAAYETMCDMNRRVPYGAQEPEDQD